MRLPGQRRTWPARALSAWLILTLAAPSPAFALRTQTVRETPLEQELAAGLEERPPNVNRMDPMALARYLERLPLEIPKGRGSLKRQQIMPEMARAVVAERIRRGEFVDAKDFSDRLRGQVIPQWNRVADGLSYGVTRRELLQRGSVTAVAVAAAAAWLYRLANPPLTRLFLLLDYHGAEQSRRVCKQLQEVREPLLVQERGPKSLRQIVRLDPALAVQLTDATALERPEVLEGLRAFVEGKVWEEAGQALQQLRAGAMSPEALDPRLRQLFQYLAAHPEVELVSERPPVEAQIAFARFEFLTADAQVALYRDRDEPASRRLLAEAHRQLLESVAVRDRAMVERLHEVLREHPGRPIVVSFGVHHQGLVQQVRSPRAQTIVRAQPFRRELVYQLLGRDPEAVLRSAQTNREVQTRFLSVFPWAAVVEALETTAAPPDRFYDAATRFFEEMPESVIRAFTTDVQNHWNVLQGAPGFRERFRQYTVAWFHQRRRLPDQIRRWLAADQERHWLRGVPEVLAEFRRAGLEEAMTRRAVLGRGAAVLGAVTVLGAARAYAQVPGRVLPDAKIQQDLEARLYQWAMRWPALGYRVATSESLTDVRPLLALWQAYTDGMRRLAAQEDSAGMRQLHQAFFQEMRRELLQRRTPPSLRHGWEQLPYSSEVFDNLILQGLVDYLAYQGVVVTVGAGAMVIRLGAAIPSEAPMVLTMYPMPDEVYQVTRTLYDRDDPIPVFFVTPWAWAPAPPTATAPVTSHPTGFSAHRAAFINQAGIARLLAAERADVAAYEQAGERLFLERASFWEAVDGFRNLQTGRVQTLSMTAEQARRFARGKLLVRDGVSEEALVRQAIAHERQHARDMLSADPAMRSVVEQAYHRVVFEAVVQGEWRAALAEWRAAPARQFLTVLNAGRWLEQDPLGPLDVDVRAVLTVDRQLFRTIVVEAGRDPEFYGIELREHSTIPREGQVIGQLDQVMDPAHPERAARLLAALESQSVLRPAPSAVGELRRWVPAGVLAGLAAAFGLAYWRFGRTHRPPSATPPTAGLEEAPAVTTGFVLGGRAALAGPVFTGQGIQSVGVVSPDEAERFVTAGLEEASFIVVGGDPARFPWVAPTLDDALRMARHRLKPFVTSIRVVTEQNLSVQIDRVLRAAGWMPQAVDAILERVRTAVFA